MTIPEGDAAAVVIDLPAGKPERTKPTELTALELARQALGNAKTLVRRHLPWLVFVGLFAVLAARHTGIWNPQFVAEEASAYWAMSFAIDPLRFLLDPWIGYLEVVPRAAFLLVRLGPPEVAPALLRVFFMAMIAAIGAFFVSRRMARAIPDLRVRLLLAVSLLFLPSVEAYDSILSLHWFAAIFLVALSLVPDRRWYDYPLAALAVLSGLPAAIAAPAFWPRRDRLAWLVTGLAVIQLALPLFSERNRHELDLAAFVNRGGWVGIVIVELVIIAARHVPRAVLWRFAVLGVATAVAGGLSAGQGIGNPEVNDRYFVAAWMLVAVVVGYGISRRDLAAVALGVLLIVTKFSPRSAPATSPPDTNWPAHAHCIGGPIPCTVPIIPAEWSVEWPGDPKLYPRPSVPKF